MPSQMEAAEEGGPSSSKDAESANSATAADAANGHAPHSPGSMIKNNRGVALTGIE